MLYLYVSHDCHVTLGDVCINFMKKSMTTMRNKESQKLLVYLNRY